MWENCKSKMAIHESPIAEERMVAEHLIGSGRDNWVGGHRLEEHRVKLLTKKLFCGEQEPICGENVSSGTSQGLGLNHNWKTKSILD